MEAQEEDPDDPDARHQPGVGGGAARDGRTGRPRAGSIRAGPPPGNPTNGGRTGLPRTEAELLERINERLPKSTRTRYHELQAKRDAETLTDAKHAELIRLVNEVEILNARRLEAVAELAKLRGERFPDRVRRPSITGRCACRRTISTRGTNAPICSRRLVAAAPVSSFVYEPQCGRSAFPCWKSASSSGRWSS
jgi:uncharacterized protein with von Willebrand factor type A (vWA) domain